MHRLIRLLFLSSAKFEASLGNTVIVQGQVSYLAVVKEVAGGPQVEHAVVLRTFDGQPDTDSYVMVRSSFTQSFQ